MISSANTNILFFLHPKADVSYIYEDNTVRQGLEKMKAHGYTAIPVITRDGVYVGTVTQGDFLWAVLDEYNGNWKSLEKVKIGQIMRAEFNPSVTVDTNIPQLLDRISNQNFVPIVDDRGVFMGIVTRKSIIEFMRKKLSNN